MLVFYKLCRIARASRAQRIESVSVTGRELTLTAAVSSLGHWTRDMPRHIQKSVKKCFQFFSSRNPRDRHESVQKSSSWRVTWRLMEA